MTGDGVRDARRWLVLYHVGRRPPEIWALVKGVPADVKREGVVEALEGWATWPAWQSRMGLGGRLSVLLEGRRQNTEARALTVLEWADLAPLTRRLTVPLDGKLYARVSKLARGRGESLSAFVTEALEWAAVEMVPAVPPEAPRFVDVPLPMAGAE